MYQRRKRGEMMDAKEFFEKVNVLCKEHKSCYVCPLHKEEGGCIRLAKKDIDYIISEVENYKPKDE